MTDPSYLLSLAVSGSDIGRLVWIAGLASLLVTTRFKPWRIAVAAFLLDRLLPFWTMSRTYDEGTIRAAASHQLSTLPQDAVALGVRFLLLYFAIVLLWRLRLALHGRRPVMTAGQAAEQDG